MNDSIKAALDLLAAPNCALFLDFDGTLVDIAPLPDQVIVTDLLRAALPLLQTRLQGRLALVSGRPINELDNLLAPLTFPAAVVHPHSPAARGGSTTARA